MFRYRTRAVVLAGVACTLVAWGTPGRSQQVQRETVDISQTYLLAQADPEAEAETPTAMTTEDPTIPVDELSLLVKPLTLAELETEAVAWQALVKAKVIEISNAEIAIKRNNRLVEQEQEAVKALEDAKAALAKAQEAQKAATPGSAAAEKAEKELQEAQEALATAQAAIDAATETKKSLQEDREIQKALDEAKQDVEEGGKTAAEKEEEKKQQEQQEQEQEQQEQEQAAAAGPKPDPYEFDLYCNQYGYASYVSQSGDEVSCTQETEEPEATEEVAENLEAVATDIEVGGVDTAAELQEKEEQLEKAAAKLEESTLSEEDLKTQLVVNVTTLQGERTALVDRFDVVLDALEAKGGDPGAYKTYIQAVTGIELDVTDTTGLGVRVLSWIQSEEGGLRWGINILKFVAIVTAAFFVSQTASKVADKTMTKFQSSALLRNFAVMMIKRGGMVLGILLGLTALEISLGPVFAVLGGLSFILGFALQSNLGNLASGLMIMAYKPFDVGDEVKVGGHWSFIHSITLATTKLKGFDGSFIILPNNNVWSGEIINFTSEENRMLTIPIMIKFEQDLEKVRDMWLEIASSHPKVLKDPAPDWFPYSLQYDYQITVYLIACAKTQDGYWGVYLDLLMTLQQRIEEVGIELTAPVQDIRVGASVNGNGMSNLSPELLAESVMAKTAPESPTTV